MHWTLTDPSTRHIPGALCAVKPVKFRWGPYRGFSSAIYRGPFERTWRWMLLDNFGAAIKDVPIPDRSFESALRVADDQLYHRHFVEASDEECNAARQP